MLYLFAGLRRHCDISECLHRQAPVDVDVAMTEIDILRDDAAGDVLDPTVFNRILADVTKGLYDIAILTPPCSSWSRAQYSNNRGPKPVRSREHPWGFQWLEGEDLLRCNIGNTLVYKSIECATAIHNAGGRYIWEHPEDLGALYDGRTPASIWQTSQMAGLAARTGATTAALHQCDPRADGSCCIDYPKPTRLLGTLPAMSRLLPYQGWPQFGKTGAYLKPLPRNCGHWHRTSLTRKAGDASSTPFRTAATASYPPMLCNLLAEIILDTLSLPARPTGGGQAGREGCEATTGPIIETITETIMPNEVTSDEDEDGNPRPPPDGTGLRGKGPPLLTRWGGKPKPFHDGAGLCSPGRCRPEDRRTLPDGSPAAQVRARLLQAVRTLPHVDRIVFTLATGKAEGSPFSDELLADLRRDVAEILCRAQPPCAAGEHRTAEHYLVVPDYQPFYLHMLSAIMRDLGDPDWRQLDQGSFAYSRGVPIGVGIKMPRTPAVFERKTKWRCLDQSDFVADRDNYNSAEQVAPQLEELFQADARLGMMFEAPEAALREQYPGDRLRVAALGAIAKSETAFRVIHDATHGVHVNNQVQPRDQVRMPGPGEERVILQNCSVRPGVHFALEADVSQAHRRFKNREQDWGLQACRLRPGTLWINRVGTFGVGSACYWWSRLAALLARFSLYMIEISYAWQLIYADDLKWTANGQDKYETLLLCLLAWAMVGTPFAWHKCRGGITVDWVGYWIDYGRFELGISESRARWLVKWLSDILDAGSVLLRRLAEGLGRLGFAAGVLEWHRPFLAPLYAWTAAAPAGAYLPLPPLVALVLRHLRDRLRSGARTVPCRMPTSEPDLVFKADAKAEGKLVVLGGWECRGRTPTSHARWFSLEVTEEQAPWFFPKGEPYRAIAALELLATVVCTVLFKRPEHAGRHDVMHLIRGATDNQGNRYVVAKLMSNRYPLSVVAMELASQLESSMQWLDLVWTPREDNHEADDLTNGDFSAFAPERRIHTAFEDLPFLVLGHLLEAGAALEGTLSGLKDKQTPGPASAGMRRPGKRQLRGGGSAARPVKRRPRDDRLRVTDPW